MLQQLLTTVFVGGATLHLLTVFVSGRTPRHSQHGSMLHSLREITFFSPSLLNITLRSVLRVIRGCYGSPTHVCRSSSFSSSNPLTLPLTLSLSPLILSSHSPLSSSSSHPLLSSSSSCLLPLLLFLSSSLIILSSHPVPSSQTVHFLPHSHPFPPSQTDVLFLPVRLTFSSSQSDRRSLPPSQTDVLFLPVRSSQSD